MAKKRQGLKALELNMQEKYAEKKSVKGRKAISSIITAKREKCKERREKKKKTASLFKNLDHKSVRSLVRCIDPNDALAIQTLKTCAKILNLKHTEDERNRVVRYFANFKLSKPRNNISSTVKNTKAKDTSIKKSATKNISVKNDKKEEKKYQKTKAKSAHRAVPTTINSTTPVKAISSNDTLEDIIKQKIDAMMESRLLRHKNTLAMLTNEDENENDEDNEDDEGEECEENEESCEEDNELMSASSEDALLLDDENHDEDSFENSEEECTNDDNNTISRVEAKSHERSDDRDKSVTKSDNNHHDEQEEQAKLKNNKDLWIRNGFHTDSNVGPTDANEKLVDDDIRILKRIRLVKRRSHQKNHASKKTTIPKDTLIPMPQCMDILIPTPVVKENEMSALVKTSLTTIEDILFPSQENYDTAMHEHLQEEKTSVVNNALPQHVKIVEMNTQTVQSEV